MRNPRCLTVVVAAILMLGLCLSDLRAQQPPQTGILFLRMRMDHGALSLISSTVRPGKLKLPRTSAPSARRPIAYDLVTAGGETIWSGAMEDPTVRRYEYEDPKEPGRLRTIRTVQDSVEFTLRIPAYAALSRVEFFRLGTAEGALAKPVRSFIGSVTVPAGGGK